MKKAFGAVCVVLVAALVVMAIYTRGLWLKHNEQAKEPTAARNELAAAREEVSAAKERAEEALRREEELAEELRATREELEKAKGRAEAARSNQQEVQKHLAAGEAGLVGRVGADGELPGLDDRVGKKAMMEVLKKVFASGFAKVGMRMGLPRLVRATYGEFLEGEILSPEERKEVEKILMAAMEDRIADFQEALAALPDTSKVDNLEAARALRKEALMAMLSEVLDEAQMDAFAEYYEGIEEKNEERMLNLHMKMAGLELAEEEAERFKEILREESVSAYPGEVDERRTMTVGDVIRRERELMERVVSRIDGVFPPEQVERYRAFAEEWIEFMGTVYGMQDAGESGYEKGLEVKKVEKAES